jgi:hypothetical protein
MLAAVLAFAIDNTTAIVIIVVVFLLVAVVISFRSRKLGFSFRAPGVKGDLKSEGAPDRAPGSMNLKDVKGGRDVRVHSGTGGDVSANKVRAGQDVDISSSNPGDAASRGTDPSPKR